MTATDEQPTGRPCGDCGGVVVGGLEPLAAGDDPELEALVLSVVGSEWCTNLECPSHHAVTNLWRLGVNDYLCKVCDEQLRAPLSAVLAHRASH